MEKKRRNNVVFPKSYYLGLWGQTPGLLLEQGQVLFGLVQELDWVPWVQGWGLIQQDLEL